MLSLWQRFARSVARCFRYTRWLENEFDAAVVRYENECFDLAQAKLRIKELEKKNDALSDTVTVKTIGVSVKPKSWRCACPRIHPSHEVSCHTCSKTRPFSH